MPIQPFKTKAHIKSLDGSMAEITVLDKVENAKQPYYIVEYNGVKCSTTGTIMVTYIVVLVSMHVLLTNLLPNTSIVTIRTTTKNNN